MKIPHFAILLIGISFAHAEIQDTMSRSEWFNTLSSLLLNADSITLEEYLPHSDHVLSTTKVSKAFVTEIAQMIKDKEFLRQPTPDEIALCFDPHHRLIIHSKKEIYHLDICFLCDAISLGSGPYNLPCGLRPITARASLQLAKLLESHSIPVRTDVQYRKLEKQSSTN